MYFQTNEVYTKCKNEAQFKKLYCKRNMRGEDYFNIETEETCGGFPDVLVIEEDGVAHLYEFKFADKNGAIKFQPTQPAFYQKYPTLKVEVIAYNPCSKCIHIFYANRIFDEESEYCTHGKARINLNKVEK